LVKRRAELYGEIEFASIAPRTLRSKRKKLDNGDGCLDVESNARSGDIANSGFAVQNGKTTQMELEQPS
jgi:hypothetical protein